MAENLRRFRRGLVPGAGLRAASVAVCLVLRRDQEGLLLTRPGRDRCAPPRPAARAAARAGGAGLYALPGRPAGPAAGRSALRGAGVRVEVTAPPPRGPAIPAGVRSAPARASGKRLPVARGLGPTCLAKPLPTDHPEVESSSAWQTSLMSTIPMRRPSSTTGRCLKCPASIDSAASRTLVVAVMTVGSDVIRSWFPTSFTAFPSAPAPTLPASLMRPSGPPPSPPPPIT